MGNKPSKISIGGCSVCVKLLAVVEIPRHRWEWRVVGRYTIATIEGSNIRYLPVRPTCEGADHETRRIAVA
jgi:hypothetical protein